MQGSASCDLIRQLYSPKRPCLDGSFCALCLRTLTPFATITLSVPSIFAPYDMSFRCAVASEWKAPIATAPSRCGVMLTRIMQRFDGYDEADGAIA